MAARLSASPPINYRRPTSLAQQSLIVAATIPFAVMAPPFAGFFLGIMVLANWDLRREVSWWVLVAAGFFLPWIYILAAIVFLALGGTKPRN